MAIIPNENEFVLDIDIEQSNEINENNSKIMQLLAWMGIVKDYVIEYGENSNGYYEKWHSGKLVQWGTIEANQNINQAYGSLFRSSANMRHTFNVEFVGAIPTLIISANTNSCFGAYLNDVSLLSFGWRPLHVVSQSVDVEISWEATGKWK